MMNNKIYQAIFDIIVPFLPDEWTKLVVYIEYGVASYSFAFFYKDEIKYTKCFDIAGVSENDLLSSFKEMDRILTSERNQWIGELWSNMTMVVDSDGNMHIDFDYTDLSSGTYQFEKEWKKKYLV